MRTLTIEEFPRYSVSEDGTICNKMRGRRLKPLIMTKGYCGVRLYLNNTQAVTKKIHRLVAEAFLPNPDNKPQVNHIDGDKTNNNAINLEWCTNQENHTHKMENGLNVGGGRRHIFDANQKIAVALYKEGHTQVEIARLIGVGTTSISRYIKEWKQCQSL